jgi:hypothetical protein
VNQSSTTISIADEFSRAPAGRYRSDGPRSGEAFREDLLIPKLKAFSTVVVNLDGTLGYGSSFLEESFGGLVRAGFKAEDLKSRIQIVSTRRFYESRVWKYISEASDQ